jgi:hypothetical protein
MCAAHGSSRLYADTNASAVSNSVSPSKQEEHPQTGSAFASGRIQWSHAGKSPV